MAGHTPGPWRAKMWTEGHPEGMVLDAKGQRVARVTDRRVEREGPANHALIAAAPELLAALQGLIDQIEGAHRDVNLYWAKQAIDKSEGR